MIIEHTFVTTLEPARAFEIASDALFRLGFDPEEPLSEGSKRWRRGAASVRKARGLLRLPQNILMNFDRGRVNLALSIDTGNRRERACFKLSEATLAAASAIETALSRGVPVAEACAAAEAKYQVVKRADRRASITRWSVLGGVLALLIGLVVLAVIANS